MVGAVDVRLDGVRFALLVAQRAVKLRVDLVAVELDPAVLAVAPSVGDDVLGKVLISVLRCCGR